MKYQYFVGFILNFKLFYYVQRRHSFFHSLLDYFFTIFFAMAFHFFLKKCMYILLYCVFVFQSVR